MFIDGLVSEVRAALLDPDKIMTKVQADSAALTPTMATALGARKYKQCAQIRLSGRDERNAGDQV
jgi:hypothetical protein